MLPGFVSVTGLPACLPAIISYITQAEVTGWVGDCGLGCPYQVSPVKSLLTIRVAHTYNLNNWRVRQEDGTCQTSWIYKEKPCPYSQAKQNKIKYFFKAYIQKKTEVEQTLLLILKKGTKDIWQEGRQLLWGFNPTVTKNKTLPTHSVEEMRPHPLSRLAVTEAKINTAIP